MITTVRKESNGLVLCKGGDNFTPCGKLITPD